MPEIFSSMDIRKVNLDGRHARGHNGVTEGNAGMGVGGRIQNDAIELAFGGLYPGNQFAFEIRLV